MNLLILAKLKKKMSSILKIYLVFLKLRLNILQNKELLIGSLNWNKYIKIDKLELRIVLNNSLKSRIKITIKLIICKML